MLFRCLLEKRRWATSGLIPRSIMQMALSNATNLGSSPVVSLNLIVLITSRPSPQWQRWRQSVFYWLLQRISSGLFVNSTSRTPFFTVIWQRKCICNFLRSILSALLALAADCESLFMAWSNYLKCGLADSPPPWRLKGVLKVMEIFHSSTIIACPTSPSWLYTSTIFLPRGLMLHRLVVLVQPWLRSFRLRPWPPSGTSLVFRSPTPLGVFLSRSRSTPWTS